MLIKFLRLPLQFFAADTGGETGEVENLGTDQQGGGDVQETDNNKGGDVQERKNDTGGTENDSEGFKESREQVQAELLKGLGFDSVEDLKGTLEKFKEYENANKTEAQKQADKLKELEKKLAEKETEASTLNAKLTAANKGVKSDAIDDVIALAKAQGVQDIDKAIDRVIEKYPQFTQAQQKEEDKKPKFTSGQHQRSGKLDPFLTALGIKSKE